MRILALDPGNTTGYCVLKVENKKPNLINVGQTTDQTLLAIEQLFKDCDIIVYETFKIRPDKAMTGGFNRSTMVPIQVIGAIQLLAKLHHKDLVPQDPPCKVPGYGFANLKYKPGAQGMHAQDAIAHCMYYAVSNKLCHPVSN